MAYKRITVIYNKNANSGNLNSNLEHLKDCLAKKMQESEISYYDSESVEKMNNYIAEICNEKKYDLIISFGGDGTVSTVCNALMNVDFDKRLPVLPIPGGTGNSLFVDFGIESIEGAFEKLDGDGYYLSDIIEVKSRNRNFYCINIIGMGFISDVAEYSVKHKKTMGGFAYVMAVFAGLGKFRPYKTKITFSDNKTFQSDKVYFLTVSNNKFTASKFMVAPEADMTDGLGDIIILHDLGRLRFLWGFSKIFKGGHVKVKGCTYLKSASMKIEASPDFYLMPDGELLQDYSPVEINVLKHQIKFALKK